MRSLRAWFALAFCAGAVALSGCQPIAATQAAGSTEPARAAPKVRAIELRLENWPRTVHVQGSLLADETSIVGVRVANRVKEVNVDLGSVVRCGDMLVTLDTEDLDSRVKCHFYSTG
jgi:membrane fusion protein, multidrug efflux system